MSPAMRLYLAGQFPSVTCSWAQVVAVSVIAVDLDPASLGWVVAAQFLPSLLLGPWFGVLADRHDRRLLVVCAEAGLGLVALGYAAASLADVLAMPELLCLAGGWGVLNALDTPARRSLVPSLMPDASLRSSSLSGVGVLVGMTAGAALGGWLMSVAGPVPVFGLNAASFAVDLFVLHRLRLLVRASEPAARSRGQVREGVRYVLSAPLLRGPMVAFAVIGTFAIAFQVSIPLLVTSGFHRGPGAMGFAFAALSVGSLVGVTWAGSRSSERDLVRPAALALVGGFVAVAVAPTLTLAVAALVLVGMAWSVYLTATVALLQGAEQRFLGRVMSLFAVLLIGSTPVGGPIANALSTSLDPRAPFVLGAVATFAGWLLLARSAAEADRSGLAAPGQSGGDHHEDRGRGHLPGVPPPVDAAGGGVEPGHVAVQPGAQQDPADAADDGQPQRDPVAVPRSRGLPE